MIHDGRIKLKCIEIYITNECNLTCSNCNRYNNYDFRGHLDWRTSENALLIWGQRITADVITIIGGEPLLHPELSQWSALLKRAWPDLPVMIQSNGTIKRYELKNIFEHNWNVGIVASLHKHGMKEAIKKNIKVVPGNWSQQLIDNTEFLECALVDQGEHFSVHNSDINAAFAACSMSRSHTLLDGLLYKCPMVAILPKFMLQYDVKLSEYQKSLLTSYEALESTCSDQDLHEFLANEDHPISQCNLCPSNGNLSPVVFHPASKNRPRKESLE